MKIGFSLLIMLCLLLMQPKGYAAPILSPVSVGGNDAIFLTVNDTIFSASVKVIKANSHYVELGSYDTDILIQSFTKTGKELNSMTIKTSSYCDVPIGMIALRNNRIAFLYHANAVAYHDGSYGWGEVIFFDRSLSGYSVQDSITTGDPSGIFLLNDSSYIVGTTVKNIGHTNPGNLIQTISNDGQTDSYVLTGYTEGGTKMWQRFFPGSIGVGDFNGGQYSFKPTRLGESQIYFPIRKYFRARNNEQLGASFDWQSWLYYMDNSGNITDSLPLQEKVVLSVYLMNKNGHVEFVRRGENSTTIKLLYVSAGRVMDSTTIVEGHKGIWNFTSTFSGDTIMCAWISSVDCAAKILHFVVDQGAIRSTTEIVVDRNLSDTSCVWGANILNVSASSIIVFSATPDKRRDLLLPIQDYFFLVSK